MSRSSAQVDEKIAHALGMPFTVTPPRVPLLSKRPGGLGLAHKGAIAFPVSVVEREAAYAAITARRIGKMNTATANAIRHATSRAVTLPVGTFVIVVATVIDDGSSRSVMLASGGIGLVRADPRDFIRLVGAWKEYD